MKKLTLSMGMALLMSFSVLSTGAMARESSVGTDDAASFLAIGFVTTAQSAEAQSRATAPVKTEDQVEAAIVAAVEVSVTNAVTSGSTSADVSTALKKALNTPGISKLVAAAFGAVQTQLASILDKARPGAIQTTGRNASLLAAPAPADAGAGYRS